MKPVRKWGVSYDEMDADRWLYAIAVPGDRIVKVGMVLDEGRLIPRLKDIRRKQRIAGLEIIAKTMVPNVNHEETEHIESFVRLWLKRKHGFAFIGRVDWLEAPENFSQASLQDLLDEGVATAFEIG